MCAERIVSGTKFLDSIRGGMSVRELMEQHDLSLGELSSIFLQLENASVDVLRLYGRTSPDLRAQDKRRLRFLPRRRVLAPVPVIDMADPTNTGLLVDVTERGLGVAGVHARLHEVKSFKIAADRVFRVSAFQLQAECRWVATKGENGEALSGFKIARITESSLRELRRFVGLLTEAEQAPDSPIPRSLQETPVDLTGEVETGWTCPSCEAWYETEQDECPSCGIIASKYIHQLERTKTEILDAVVEQPGVRIETKTLAAGQSVQTTITTSDKLLKELKALGGNFGDHVNKALSEYVLRMKARKGKT